MGKLTVNIAAERAIAALGRPGKGSQLISVFIVGVFRYFYSYLILRIGIGLHHTPHPSVFIRLVAVFVGSGMGGLNGGAQAAREACAGFFEEYESAVLSGQGASGFPQIARKLDRRVLHLRDTDGLPLDGGSTLTAVVIQNGLLHWLSVGDSRIGLLRNGQLHWLNRLHNYRLELDEALKNGDISPDEYQAELPRGTALLSYLGCGELKYIDYQTGLPLLPSDLLLLCSDGFYDLLPGETLVSTLEALDETMANLPELLEPFLGQASRSMDNASAVIIRFLGEQN